MEVIIFSGRFNGVGEKLEGGLRPRRPSGEDCNEVLVIGLAVEDGGAPLPFGVTVLAGVNVTGTDVSIRCLGVDLVEGEGGDQLPLPLGRRGVIGRAAAGAMMQEHPVKRRLACYTKKIRGLVEVEFVS